MWTQHAFGGAPSSQTIWQTGVGLACVWGARSRAARRALRDATVKFMVNVVYKALGVYPKARKVVQSIVDLGIRVSSEV